MGFVLDSRQAQLVMGEVLEALESSSVGDYRLVGVKGGKGSEYSVYVRAFVGTARKQELYRIVEKYSLSLVEDREGIIIK